MNTEQWIPICWFISIYLEAGQLYEAATKSAKNGSYSSASVASVFALEALGNFLERQGRIDEAAKTYDRAIQEATGDKNARKIILTVVINVKSTRRKVSGHHYRWLFSSRLPIEKGPLHVSGSGERHSSGTIASANNDL